VSNTKVAPNTLIYLQKNHIFLKVLNIFPDFLSSSALNRNSFKKSKFFPSSRAGPINSTRPVIAQNRKTVVAHLAAAATHLPQSSIDVACTVRPDKRHPVLAVGSSFCHLVGCPLLGQADLSHLPAHYNRYRRLLMPLSPFGQRRDAMPHPLGQGVPGQWSLPVYTCPKPTPSCSPKSCRPRLLRSRAQLAAMAVPDRSHAPNRLGRPCPSTISCAPT
jgi:hypothetical protein